ncbi:MAG: hypothetical protein WCQ47_07490 [bacterium]
MEKLKTVKTQSPSFPDAKQNVPLCAENKKLWQVFCGDKEHWRTGLYSPEADSAESIDTLEKHSCSEFFILLSGNVSLLIEENNTLKTVVLEPLKPILVDTWHNGFCPKGKNSGTALVVERDEFTTEYKSLR